MAANTHSVISPAILYWGTPVTLISSENEDGTHNLCPISSVFWLGHRCVLGFGADNETSKNILRTGECVVNLPDDAMTSHVNALALTTGTNPPSESKVSRGYQFVKDKWAHAGLTPQPSDLVRPSRIRECPVQMECKLISSHGLMEDLPDRAGFLIAIELHVLRVHVVGQLRMPGHANRINPDAWRPMIMSFQELYGLSDGKVAKSRLAQVNEERYRAFTYSDIVKLPGDEDKAHMEGKVSEEKLTKDI